MRLLRTVRKFASLGKTLTLSALLVYAPATAMANPLYAGIVVDAKTGKTLYAAHADSYRFPASLTKIMTTYIIFEELEAGRLSMSSRFKVSKNAAAEVPSKLGLKPGTTISVKDAIGALVTKSANDVATTVAENIEGSEAAFARRMTRTARQLGMNKTTFRNAHGLPNSKQRTTARDMATLGRAIQERFPEYYKLFNTRVYTYKGRRLNNHNRLLGRVKGVDGIKTGYIRASGFNLVTSVKRDGRHIVAVVMGGRTGARRNAHMTDLIGRYLHKASRGPRTAPLIASPGKVRTFVAANLENPPLPAKKPGSEPAPATGAPMVLAFTATGSAAPVPAPAPEDVIPAAAAAAPAIVPGFGSDVPLPPKMVKQRFDRTFAVANALPPVPQAAPDAPLTTQSISTAALKAAAQREEAPDLPTRSDERAPTAPLPVKTVKVEPIQITPGTAPAIVAASAVGAPVEEDVSPEDNVTVATNNTPDIEPGWQVQIAATETEGQAITMLKQAKSKTGSALRGKVPYTEPVETGGQTLYRARFVGFDTKSAAWKACKSLKRARYACFAIYQ
ncbi:peptidase S11 [Roseibium denhamense]|nr:D-alanyl-D-alanine carboxypeptidase [Roseibium denhamense]MTI04086.1 peptidase S11 [Roseibium denhamense]